MLRADTGVLGLSAGDSVAGSAHDDVEVHTEDADTGVVLDSEVDVLKTTRAGGVG